jgi:hypothetical protein
MVTHQFFPDPAAPTLRPESPTRARAGSLFPPRPRCPPLTLQGRRRRPRRRACTGRDRASRSAGPNPSGRALCRSSLRGARRLYQQPVASPAPSSSAAAEGARGATRKCPRTTRPPAIGISSRSTEDWLAYWPGDAVLSSS